MNDQQICVFLAKKPRSRATELANHFNVELTVVSSSLRSLVDVGDLIKSKEFDDNGRQSQVYELSDEFRKSREGKQLLTSIEWKGPVEAAPAAAPAAAAEVSEEIALPPAPAETKPPPAAHRNGPRPSKVQLALDCITASGSATDDQLRTAMGLPAKTYVAAYLASAIKAGKVMRWGETWVPGQGSAQVARPALESVETVGNIVVATRDATPVPAAVVAAIAAPSAPVPIVPAAPVLRCALWSDGTLELQRNGEEVARLAEDEIQFVMAYMTQRVAA